MAGSGVRRKVDDLGRVVIPASMRKVLAIGDGDLLEIHLEGDRIVMAPASDACVFCGSELHVQAFHDRAVCWSCLAALRLKAAGDPPAADAG